MNESPGCLEFPGMTMTKIAQGAPQSKTKVPSGPGATCKYSLQNSASNETHAPMTEVCGLPMVIKHGLC